METVEPGPPLRTALAALISGSGAWRPLARLAERRYGGFVLAFHDLPVARFREHVEALAPSEPVHLDEIVARVKRGASTAGLFAITVDDGVGDTVRGLGAAAAERGWPVTFFLPTRYLDEARGMPFQWLDNALARLPSVRLALPEGEVDLSTREARAAVRAELTRAMYTRPADAYVPRIRALVEHALEIGCATREQLESPAPISWREVADLATRPELRFESHGVSHRAVSALEPAELERELVDSRDRIAEHTGRPCRHFCYPFGGPESIGGQAPGAVARHYESAVTMARGRVGGRDPHLLPRVPLYPRDTAAVARLKLLVR